MQGRQRLFCRLIYASCALFVTGTLIYNYYGTDSTINIESFNESISIELVLEQIPTCTPGDRSRQRALLAILQAWTQFAHQHHIRYWIAYGTLVGYVQRQGLLPHDEDIDILIMAQDTPQLIESSPLNLSSIYELRVHPQWFIPDETKRAYFHSEEIDFIAPNARFIDLEDEVHIDIWAMYDYNPDEERFVKNSKPMLTEYDKYYNWKSSPKDWTFPLQECLFSGIKVWCPAEPQTIVGDIYGKVSVNVSSTKCVDGSWVRSDEYTFAKKKMKMEDKSFTVEQTEYTSSASTELPTSYIDDVTTTVSDDSDLIETALEQIPTCTPGDRSRQRIILTNLQAWAHLAEKYNLQYWLSFGTLVGYVQRRGLLPHDQDVDITMMSDDTPQLIKISQLNYSLTHEIKVHPQWNIVGDENRDYFRDEGIHFVAPNARYIGRETGNYVDVFPAYDFNPLYSTNLTKEIESANLTEYTPSYKWLSYPRNWTFPLQICYFSDIKVLCPAEPEKLVEVMFSSSALNKSDTKCVDGKWVDAD